MHFTAKPESDAKIVSALSERAADPYRGTPLGVEAAWWPNGIDVLSAVAALEEAP